MMSALGLAGKIFPSKAMSAQILENLSGHSSRAPQSPVGKLKLKAAAELIRPAVRRVESLGPDHA